MLLGKTEEEKRTPDSEWREAFAFLPVRLWSGQWLWLEWYKWRRSDDDPENPGRKATIYKYIQRMQLDMTPDEIREAFEGLSEALNKLTNPNRARQKTEGPTEGFVYDNTHSAVMQYKQRYGRLYVRPLAQKESVITVGEWQEVHDS